MPLWMSALKVIPWGDVIEAAPGLVKGARKMFARTQEGGDAATDVAVAEPGKVDSPTRVQERVAHLELSLAQMAEQQQASAQIIESLAEQNAKVVQAIDILRARTRLLLMVSGVLAVALVVVLVWVLR